jgi:hypothetical protein
MAGGARSGLGWMILVLALAVPGLLFYNWWSALKAEREKAVAAKAKERIPPGGVFSTPPADAAGKLVNPIAPSTAAAPAPAGGPEDAAAASTVVAATPVAAPSSTPAPAPPSVEPSVSSSVVPVISLRRDPMLSPGDLVRIQQEALERRLAEEALRREQERRNRPAPVKRAPPPETLIELQGIVESPDGDNKAIVNNEVVGVGEVVAGSRIVKITASGVVFEHKGRRFVKGVSRD